MSTIFDPAATASVDTRFSRDDRASVGAIVAGVVVALVVLFLLNLLGVGVGASSVDATNPVLSAASTYAGAWAGMSALVASLAGGLAAGRLCGAGAGNTARWHRLVSWCATTLIVFYLVATATGSIAGGVFSAVGLIGRGATTFLAGTAQSIEGIPLQAQVRRLVNPHDAQTAEDDVLAYIRAILAGDGQQADATRDRALDSLAHAANLSPDDARAQLDQAQRAAVAAKQKAQQPVEATRKATASAGLYGFVALLIGAVAAWFGGGLGAPAREEY